MRLISHPVLCNYYLTYRCNASCAFCDIWEKPSPYANLDAVKKNLLDLRELKVKVIDFTGGEPLLHRDLPEILAFAKSLGFITTVTTNCLLYPKHAEALAGKIDMLHFSLDSVIPEKHNASRKVECFRFLMDSIHIAKSLGERPDILFTVNNENYTEIEALHSQFVKELGLIVILNPLFRYNSVGDDLCEEALNELQKWAGVPGIYVNEAFIDLRKNGGNHIADPVCKAASTTLVIGPDNELILPCYHLGEKKFSIEDNLKALWNSAPVQQQIKSEGKLPGCEGCTVNCYMEPSFAVEWNAYFAKSLKSTVAYSLEKWVY